MQDKDNEIVEQAVETEVEASAPAIDEIFFSLPVNCILTERIMRLYEKAQRFGRHEGRYSIEQFCLSLMESAEKAFNRTLDAGEDLRNMRGYTAARNQLPTPPPLNVSDPASVKAHMTYLEADAKLQARWKQGGKQATL